MTERFRITITDVVDAVKLHLYVKRNFPIVYKIKSGLISTGEFCTAYGIVEAQRIYKALESAGAKVKIVSTDTVTASDK